MRSPTWLLDRAKNVYSQAGEDGIIEAILEVLPDPNRWCVEFGAWDGHHLCNARNLIENHGFSSVLIEGDADKARELKANYAPNPNVYTKHQFVGYSATDNLDTLLATAPIPKDFDVLVVDIDGNDFHVWKATDAYRPKLVVIEFNPTIPNEVSFVQAADPSTSQGASLTALVNLAKSKGYELVCALAFNGFFVRQEDFDRFEIADNRIETLRTDTDHVTYLFSGYDGTVFLRGATQLPWHQLAIDESKMQLLPKGLRKYPNNYSAFQRWWFKHFISRRALHRRLGRGIGRLTKGSR